MTTSTHDVAAEEAVIASCLVDAGAVERCGATGLVADDFFITRARYAYGAIRAVAGKLGPDGVNRVTVGYELAQRPAGDGTTRTQVEVVTLAWLSRIEEELPTSIGAEWYAGIVRECAQRRREAAVGQALIEGRATGEQAAAALVPDARPAQRAASRHQPAESLVGVVRPRAAAATTEDAFSCWCGAAAVAYDANERPVCPQHGDGVWS